MMVEDERELVRRCQAGDQEAWKTLFDRHQSQVYHLALRMVRHPEDARELTQEIFLKIFAALRHFRFQSRLSTWVYKIALNSCYEFLRKRKPVKELELVGQSTPPQGTEMETQQDMQREVQQALARLPPRYRTVLILKEIQGLSYAEIAEVVGCSEGAVASRLNRARQRLQKILKRYRRVRGKGPRGE